uniref:Uncharacterized protein n=1 Tax=Chromera velia CCMP2878 TaxID=1169474 RepID=A0A0G4I5K1_9ALVE|eukprot:Cvel_11196.t1-p1 / transcript=Cvel_11196.t1 / gene=Cvel_11196 / organism=Chromera_velia_CCMP2878 / gene_product=hypothetical protein / transcript_product=hypothetical protein / location=Cvel_scaffold696:3225-4413(+) / protein_length=305 / sequence_SO=supercontig / SO=protein_coding / is_pseudo=false
MFCRAPSERLRRREFLRVQAPFVRVVVLVIAGGGAEIQVPEECLDLREQSSNQLAVIPCVDPSAAEKLDEQFRPWVEVLKESPVWADPRFPNILARVLRRCLENFVSAEWVFVVSHNSVPVSSWREIEEWTFSRRGLSFPSSFDWTGTFDNTKVSHVTWHALHRTDAQTVASVFGDETTWAEYQKEQVSMQRKAGSSCPVAKGCTAAEEWMVGTLLVREHLGLNRNQRILKKHMDEIKKRQNGESDWMYLKMEQVSSKAECQACGGTHNRVYRAAAFKWKSKTCTNLVQKLRVKKDTLFMRKAAK